MCSASPRPAARLRPALSRIAAPPRVAKRRRAGLAAVLAALAAPSLAAAGELRVCADPNDLPFSNAAGEGFENRIVSLLAADLGDTVAYTWHAQRRGFLRETLKAGRCDLVAGMPSTLEGVRTTRPYYRSAYAFVTRRDTPAPGSLNDAALRTMRVGVQLIGDDGWNTPPAHALAKRGIVGNVRGYMVYGDYRRPDPAASIVAAVAGGEVDVALVWGPVAGYYAARQSPALSVAPVRPLFDGPQLPMAWDISMAVRKEDGALADRLDAALERHRAEVDAILADYRVPRLDRTPQAAEAAP